MAMTYLLDDPSPQVRLALAQAIAISPESPRDLVTVLAEDQPEIACTIIAHSPVLTDADLVDLVGRGDCLTRGFVASRGNIGRGVCAALAEVAGEGEIRLLLDNATARLPRRSLARIAERFGDCADIRGLLLEREDLPADVRHRLVILIGDALANSDLVSAMLARPRLERITREAGETAAISLAGEMNREEIPALIEHMRSAGRLTPALLIQALCSGKVDFFAAAIVCLSGLDEKRVRALLATGRMHAVRALFESIGLDRPVAVVFVEATMLQRDDGVMGSQESVCELLLRKHAGHAEETDEVSQLLALVERLQQMEVRLSAPSFANGSLLAA